MILQHVLALLAAAAPLALAEPQTAAIYIQPISSSTIPPAPLAEITYDPAEASDPTGQVTSFEPPELPESTSLVRIGVFDAAADEWLSSTSVASVDNFSKGYSPHFVLTLGPGAGGEGPVAVIGAAVKGVKVDAGATRDFGPQAVLVSGERAPQPALNRPVVLNKDGAGRAGEVEEKTLLQKYWWALGLLAFVMITGGGPDK
ncbi:hypothetical protein MCOR27_010237 [Pyricularia oryzae]|uniref:Cyclin-dependent protein kinase regulator pho80 n=1 Tax=Pyricularia grisea TaxID=148305 RepID=A0ABQ8N7A3_PYRGI|nr:hypothetical protein MCOR01_005248 [Pyricularia oryzae]KAI6292098.1 hypothetical protein MCOR33_010106 [Pyricularia grisea]KAH9427624.1 hypothetical protein MCOR02_011860 [Pyricularia oryzae]KAI6255236.1 hypothetical protein MCOR19_008264 [Pyricularia oryzae]KAI6265555.1 hypothetical protein MCOR26_010680 [Pyricularia oryzae]